MKICPSIQTLPEWKPEKFFTYKIIYKNDDIWNKKKMKEKSYYNILYAA